MQKMKNIGKPIVFILFTVISVLALEAIDQDRLFYFHPYGVLSAHVAVFFLYGMFLSTINKNLKFQFSFFYLVISILCILAIIFLYVFYSSLSYFFAKNLNVIQLFLSTYSGANFLSALFKDKNLDP